MTLVSPTQSNAGDTIEAADINTPVNQLAAVINGGLDSSNLAANGVTTTQLANASVTPSKLALAPATATVATDESTSSTSFVDLATTTDSVTVTIGANGVALVGLYANMYNTSTTGHIIVGFAVSGATTVAASSAQALDYQAASASVTLATGAVFLVTGLTAGSNTFKMKYAQSVAGVAHAFNRRITVVPL